jgi:uncharacterized membrane protein
MATDKMADDRSASPSGASALTRVIGAGVVGVIALAISAFLTPWQVSALLGWDAAAVVFVGWIWKDVWPLSTMETRLAAKTEDDFEAAAHDILVMASLVSLVGVGFALLKASQETGGIQAAITAVAVVSVVLSWLAVHTVFTLRYARQYYAENAGEGGGIDFHGTEPPDYRDFAYIAFTLGMTYQVSDTDVGSREIRRTVLRHALISYVFGVSVVAVVVNVVASLLTA